MIKKPHSQPKIVLASSSIYRQAQLDQLGIPFTCTSPNIDESPLENEKPDEIALRLSIAKAVTTGQQLKVQANTENYLIIGSDQTAAVYGTLLNKPLSAENASKQLRACSNQSVIFYSGLAIYDTRTQTTYSTTITTEVKFRELQEDEIYNYIKADNPIYCAGSFKWESLGISLFDYVRSDDPSALTGLPLISLNKTLLALDFNVLKNQKTD